MNQNTEKEERLNVLLYNAIGYMIEQEMQISTKTTDEVYEGIASYLGASVEELVRLGVLHPDEI